MCLSRHFPRIFSGRGWRKGDGVGSYIETILFICNDLKHERLIRDETASVSENQFRNGLYLSLR